MPNRLIPAERQEKIRRHLQEDQFVNLADLANELGVSESTIRRDLDKLEKDGFLERTHGGALLSKKMNEEPVYIQSEQSHPAEKKWIGMAASQLVESGDTIFLSSGTTIAQVARHINDREDLTKLTIITNNVSAALEIDREDIKVILVGGVLRKAANAVGGRFAVNVIKQTYSDKAIIGADGLSFKFGCTSPVETEAEISRLMIEHAHGKVILAADHSKWGVISNYHVAQLNEFHVYVTDPGIPAGDLATLQDQDLEIIICDEEGIVTKP
jgi:DeoR family fructose operon transcriptional repressor